MTAAHAPPPPPHPGDVVLGLDVGEARIGVARAEAGSPFAFGRGTIPGGDDRATVTRITDLVAQERASRVVVGLPVRTDGRDSPQTARVRALADRLAASGILVELADERFTTQAAQRALRAGSLPRGKRREKGRLDEASAVLILEGWLARHLRAAHTDDAEDMP
jgi:putative holliday junction resolvase